MNETTWRTGPFTGRLWSDAAEILTRVGGLTFLTELAEGTLDPGIFVHYIQQDEFYLANYSRAMAVLASRAPTSDAAEFWAGSASSAVAEEKILHEQLLSDPRLSGHDVPEAPSATTRAPALARSADPPTR